MDIINAIKRSKLVVTVSRMNPFLLTFGLLMVFLIFGGVLGKRKLTPDSDEINSRSKEHNHHSHENSAEFNRNLKLVHVVMRHSIRAPVSLYPNDPHFNFDFPPNGRGQLTMQGISYAYDIGEYFRQRYGSYLGRKYNVSEYYSESTGVERAQATIMTVNAALWKPQKEQRFRTGLPWFPVPVFTTNLEEDKLLLVSVDCPQYNIERQKIENSDEVQSKLDEYRELMKFIEEKSGQTMNDFHDIGDIYATLLAEKTYGLNVPEWTEPIFPRMEEAAAYSFVIKAYNKKMQRLKGGVLLNKIRKDWENALTNQSPKKMFLYGGHDSTIANLLSTLQIFEPQVPNYGMAILLELSYDDELKTHGIEIFTKNSTALPKQLTIPGCNAFCPLEDFIRLTNDVVPENWEEECATDDDDYTPPPMEGP